MTSTEKTRRQRQRKALAPGKKSHGQRRDETKPLNDTPNDIIRVEESAKVKACQRCHHKFAKQFSVVLSDEGERSIVTAQAGASHYCADCAKERRDELQRFDARPKKAKASPAKPKPKAKRRESNKSAVSRKNAAKAALKKGTARKNAAKVETAEEPF